MQSNSRFLLHLIHICALSALGVESVFVVQLVVYTSVSK